MTKRKFVDPSIIPDPTNWNPQAESFADWLRADSPSRIVSDLRTAEERRRSAGYDKDYYEPENP